MNKNSFLRKSLLAILVFSLLVGVFSQKSIAALMYNNTYSTATSAGVASDGTMTIYSHEITYVFLNVIETNLFHYSR